MFFVPILKHISKCMAYKLRPRYKNTVLEQNGILRQIARVFLTGEQLVFKRYRSMIILYTLYGGGVLSYMDYI